MNNILRFPDSKSEDSIGYMDLEGSLGITTLDRKIGIFMLNADDFTVMTPDGEQLHTRKELAEFLWFAASFVDGDEKWRKDGEIVACNY